VRDDWIAQPSAFYSSVFVIIFALLLHKNVSQKSQHLTLFVISLIILGISSHLAHASFTEFGLAMDFAGIILVTSFFTIIKWIERWTKSFPLILIILALYSFGVWNVFYSMEKWYKISLSVFIFGGALAEMIYSEGKALFKAREIQLALGILAVSFVFFIIDEFKILCSPESYLQNHSIWHFGTSVSLYFYGKWRFRPSQTGPLQTI
jgi:hypothetical protein